MIEKIDNKTIAFLNDWRKRTGKQWGSILKMFILLFILTFVLLLGFSYWFQYRNYDRIVKQNMRYVQDGAIQEANQVERELKSALVSAQNFAKQYAQLMRTRKDLTDSERLQLIEDKNLFDRLSFVTMDGTDIYLDYAVDISDREYFKRVMKGESGWESIRESRITGNPALIFYTPVYQNDRICGALLCFYEQPRVDAMFSYDFFNYVPRSYLLRRDGSIIADTNEKMLGDNILDLLSTKTFIGEVDYDYVMDVINDADRTTVTFSYREGRETNVGVIVQFKSSDWMIMSVLPNDVTAGMIEGANRTGMLFVVVTGVMFILVIISMLLLFRKMSRRFDREMSVAVDSLEKTINYEEYQFSVIRSLSNIYTCVYYVDIKDKKYRRIKDLDDRSDNIPEFGGWDEGVATYCDGYVAEEYREDVRAFMDYYIDHPEEDEIELVTREYQRIDGTWKRSNLIAIREETEDGTRGRIASFVFVVQPIDLEKRTELETRKALKEAYEAAQLASNAKTRFLSNMSHDIRTPMNAIIGMTTIAMVNLEDREKVTDCLKKITVSSKHLLGLINEILDMSKIESGKVDLCEDEFSLPELMDTLVTMNMPLVNEKHHSLVVKVQGVTHENVIGDSIRLQQVLTNLLTNAIKYTPEGGKIEIFISEKEMNKATMGLYEIVIKDNGIGMTEEFRERIFEPFARATDERLDGVQGTGLGMAIAKNIIRMMNGDITVESKLNEGSTFKVSFALKLQNDSEIDYERFVDLPVLVVDDDEDACESTCIILDSLKMNSEWVTSGAEALVKLAEHHEADNDYYVVVLDWKMPDMDGLEVTRRIREVVGDEVPIIILSAYDWTDIEKEAKEAGVNALISKPLFKSKIVDVFNEVLGEQDESAAVTSTAETLEEKDFTGKRILLAEDNEMNREIVVELMSMVGFEIEAAENGQICVDMFAEHEVGYYDAILMDIQMPVLDGYGAARKIRAMEREDAAQIPIIALTANAFSTDVRSAYDSGMNAHLAKPVDMNQVVHVLKEFL